MAASLEETLISVWQQAMVEEAKTITVEGRTFPVRRTSRSRLREVSCAGSSRIRKPARDGRGWHAKERRSCNFSENGAISQLSWMERCSSMEKWDWISRVSVRPNEIGPET